MKTPILFALALAAAAPVAMPAHADRPTAVEVRFNDLDLNRPSDAVVMLGRLDQAALQACGASRFSLREYQQSIRWSRCYADGMGRAVSELNAPALTAAYERETGRAE
ncbi:MAG TPA: UrcA family protein [Caulobacteraceae bacterium]|nr:UrcA family protein [Caulobacteraceae bacterium]